MCCSTGVCGPGVEPLLDAAALERPRGHEAVHLRELVTRGKRTALEPSHANILAAESAGA